MWKFEGNYDQITSQLRVSFVVESWFMKKILGIVVLSLLWCNTSNSAKVNCSGGECEFTYSVHYVWANTSCYETIFNEEVETNVSNFTIVKTGQQCQVFESK
jgi:hypothetical protein